MAPAWAPENRAALQRLRANGSGPTDPRLQAEVQELRSQDVDVTLVYIAPEAVRDYESTSEVLLLPAELVATLIHDSGVRPDVLRIGLSRSRKLLEPYAVPRLKAEVDLSLGGCETGEQQILCLLSAYRFFRASEDERGLLRCQVWLAQGLLDAGLPYDCLRICDEAARNGERLESERALGVIDCIRGQVLGHTVHARDGLRAIELALSRLQPAVPESNRWLRCAQICKLESHARLGDLEGALELASQLQDSEDTHTRASASLMLAKAHAESGRHEQASEHIQDAIASLSSMVGAFRGRLERDRLLNRNKGVFDLANQIALNSGNSDLALVSSVYVDSVGVVGRWRHGSNRGAFPRLQEEASEELSVLRDHAIAAASGDPAGRQECSDRARELVDKFHVLALSEDAHELAAVKCSWDGVQRSLPPDAGLLKFFVSATHLGVAFATNHSLKVMESPLELSELRVIQHMFNADCLTLSDSGALGELGRLLVAPFEDEIEACDSVYVHGAGHAGRVPIHALSIAGLSTKDVRYLVGPLVDGMRLDPIRLPGKPKVLAIGAAETQYGAGERLGFVESELERIERVFPDAKIFKGAKATSERVMAEMDSADIVHLGCHAEHDPEYPLLSRLYLYDRPYFMFEWMVRASRQVQLVVLNSCESGMASSRSGETLGIGRVVSEAGAFVIGCSWHVTDESAFRFADSLYGGIAASGQVAASVVRARQDLRASPEHSHVGLWGAHVFLHPVL